MQGLSFQSSPQALELSIAVGMPMAATAGRRQARKPQQQAKPAPLTTTRAPPPVEPESSIAESDICVDICDEQDTLTSPTKKVAWGLPLLP